MLSGIILGYERLPKHDSRQGNHLGIFIILFKYLSKYTIFIIIRFYYSTTCENRASTSSCSLYNAPVHWSHRLQCERCLLELDRGGLCEDVHVIKYNSEIYQVCWLKQPKIKLYLFITFCKLENYQSNLMRFLYSNTNTYVCV